MSHLTEKREISKKKLARWWLTLNSWKIPRELLSRMGDDRANKDQIRGAFKVVDSLISFRDVRELDKKYKLSRDIWHSQNRRYETRNSMVSDFDNYCYPVACSLPQERSQLDRFCLGNGGDTVLELLRIFHRITLWPHSQRRSVARSARGLKARERIVGRTAQLLIAPATPHHSQSNLRRTSTPYMAQPKTPKNYWPSVSST